MTIQIYGSFYTGCDTFPIEQYFDNLKDAQEAWDSLINHYSNCLGGKIYAILNEEDNVRPKSGYGENICIGGKIINSYVLR